MKTGILPQAPGKKIACAIFEIGCANFPLACTIFQFGRRFCIGLHHFCIWRAIFKLMYLFPFGLRQLIAATALAGILMTEQIKKDLRRGPVGWRYLFD